MRPDGKARRVRIPGVCERGATQLDPGVPNAAAALGGRRDAAPAECSWTFTTGCPGRNAKSARLRTVLASGREIAKDGDRRPSIRRSKSRLRREHGMSRNVADVLWETLANAGVKRC